MKILEVTTRETANTITMYAKCKIRRIGYDEAYFTFDKKYAPFLTIDASPFAAALLIPSMKQGEDLIIKGAISQQLYNGMGELMNLLLSWDIGLKPITIKAAKITPDTGHPHATGSFFSGGVDSFYSFLKHKNDKVDPLTHLILVDGYDIDPRNRELWNSTLDSAKKTAKAEQVELIAVKSNMRTLIDPILPWDYTHGGCLTAVALCLRKGLKQTYIPSSLPASQQIPWGTHLDADHLWSTENLSFIHDGTEASRVDKINWQIAKSPTALKYLRVCYMNEVGTFNCGECEKCLRTMINLYVADALDKSDTFPHTLDPKKVATIVVGEHTQDLHKENLAALQKKNAPRELQEAMAGTLQHIIKEEEPPFSKRLASFLVYIDHVYFRSYLFKVTQQALGRKF